MAIKTAQSINGFIASDPRITFNDAGQARFYARIGINHYQRNSDGSFTELEPSFHDLIQFGKGAELSTERFRKGDNFLAQGYVRDYTHVVDGEERAEQQFVTNRLAHDPNTTTYEVQRRTRGGEAETPAAERDSATRDAPRPVADRPAVAASHRDQLPPPSQPRAVPASSEPDGLRR